jgi:hypothetical protein
MRLTGFDAPSCSTVYLDKPMRNHTLMQTIVRARRMFPGKHSGVIVDYASSGWARCSTAPLEGAEIVREGPPPLDLSRIDFDALA